ncbi:RNA polymerase sigma factor [Parabacteroides sp. OttesenSCG-928-N08]|nr:RNA polymerase sigma factor [Parabacteroides sp. OttesenSCG-928-N08]
MDVKRFKALYLPLHPKLYRVALALVENRQDAEDLLQETYGKLWSKRMELSEILNPEAYAVTLIKHLCLDFLRSTRANLRQEEIHENIWVADGTTPATQVEKQDEVAYVEGLIAQLPDSQRQVIRLRGIGECSMEEIAEITGFSLVNVRTLLSRARKVLREQYDKYMLYERV